MNDSNVVGPPAAPSLVNSKFPDVDYPVMDINLNAPPFSSHEVALIRDKFVTKVHTIPDKMLLYNSST